MLLNPIFGPAEGYPYVHWRRPELAELMPQYELIGDAISGEVAVKRAGDKYLPRPDKTDCSQSNKERYEAYKTRAVFYNVARTTLFGLLGQVFMRDPVVDLPESLKPVEEDSTGTGITLVQQSKDTMALTLAYSRSGLFVDYPATEKPTSISEMAEGYIRPTVYTYAPTEIVNWRVTPHGAKDKLSLVVLYETYCYEDDGFQKKNAEQYRVLRLDESGEYVQDVYREEKPREPKATNTQYKWVKKESFKPTTRNLLKRYLSLL